MPYFPIFTFPFFPIMKCIPLFAFYSLLITSFSSSAQQPLKVNFKNSASYRWLNKKVQESRKLDGMESLDHWQAFSIGADPIWDARVVAKPKDAENVAKLMLSAEQVHDGNYSLLLRTPVRLPGPAPKNGRGWGRSGLRRQFDGEDWRQFNRLSFWIWPDLPGFYTTALDLQLFNDGTKKLPALFGQEGQTSIILQNHSWNHVVWEISNVERDRITGFEISYGLSGSYPGEADSIGFYFDRLDLERVEADKIEGWDVWPGRISYSHPGYQNGAAKTAILSDPETKIFSVIDQDNGEVVLSKPVQTVKTQLGVFQQMDFSELRKTGSYALEAGDIKTHPFSIGPAVWKSSILKALNFLYTERCGMAIPGVHGVCHGDWISEHEGKKIIINGGWHDAGDLSQGPGNTAEIVYGLFSLAERLNSRNEDPELYKKVMDEACWGLNWLMKTSFGDGYRCGSINSRRTNNILGDDDDVISKAHNSPMDNFICSAAEAIAGRVLKTRDPALAALALKMSAADWQFGVDSMNNKKSNERWTGTFDSDNIEYEIPAEGILAAVDLWIATGDKLYKEKATAWAQLIVNSQQRKKPDWDKPLTGFFYTGPDKTRLLHFVHRGRDQAHILALTKLCEAFPDHTDWMQWYSAVTLYSEYLKAIAKYTAPYNVMPASIYNDSEYLHVPDSRRESFRKQVLNGIPLGKGNYLRLFPVWMDYRGNFGTILPQAQSLASAGLLRGDRESEQLAAEQAEWIIGRNPFSESTMYGEGYDFTPLYSPSSGDLVGALPVGIQTRDEKDIPYWPVQSMWTYKEVWVHPVGRWMWLMKDLYGPALVEGFSGAKVKFKEIMTGTETVAEPDLISGRFRIMLPQGKYRVDCNGEEQVKTFLSSATYQLDLRPGNLLDFDIAKVSIGKGRLAIRITARGNGTHHFSIRVNNLKLTGSRKELILKPGEPGTLEWTASIDFPDEPWVAVLIPDDDLSGRKEISGAAWEP